MLTQCGLRDSELFYLAARRTRAAQTPTRDFDSALAAPMTQIGA